MLRLGLGLRVGASGAASVYLAILSVLLLGLFFPSPITRLRVKIRVRVRAQC